jgi:hypothetical protein
MQWKRNRTILRRFVAVAGSLVLLIGGAWLVGKRRGLTSTEEKLVGTWTMPSPVGAGLTRAWIFGTDRSVTIGDLANKSGPFVSEVTSDGEATWFVDGQTLVIRKQRSGSSFFDEIWGQRYNIDRLPIASLSDDVIELGNEAWGTYRVVLKRESASRTAQKK